MEEQSRQEMLKNLSPELREEYYKFEIETLELRLNKKNKYLIMYQILIMVQVVLYIIRSFTK